MKRLGEAGVCGTLRGLVYGGRSHAFIPMVGWSIASELARDAVVRPGISCDMPATAANRLPGVGPLREVRNPRPVQRGQQEKARAAVTTARPSKGYKGHRSSTLGRNGGTQPLPKAFIS